jgi:hypothetical protein
MSFFDFFKKKADAPQTGELSLEMLLQKAATEPAFRAQFSQRLLTDEVIVITQNSGRPPGEHVLEEDSTISIVALSDGRIPIFTSTDRIFDEGVINEEVHFTAMKGVDLFETTRGATLVINPFSQYRKDLLAGEIEQMLDGSLAQSKKITIQKDTPVQIGQPANFPDALVASLQKLFAERPNVNAAYLGWIYNPESGDPPHLIFSIDADGDFQTVVNEAGFTAEQYLEPSEVVDFVKFGNGTLDDYFESTKPFYKL